MGTDDCAAEDPGCDPEDCEEVDVAGDGGDGCVPAPCGDGEFGSPGDCDPCAPPEGGDGATTEACGPEDCPEGQVPAEGGEGCVPPPCGEGEFGSPGDCEPCAPPEGGDGATAEACGPEDCPEGQVPAEGGEGCVPPPCPEGEVPAPGGEGCVPAPCPEGQVRAPLGEGCVPAPCPEGQARAPGGEGCVPTDPLPTAPPGDTTPPAGPPSPALAPLDSGPSLNTPLPPLGPDLAEVVSFLLPGNLQLIGSSRLVPVGIAPASATTGAVVPLDQAAGTDTVALPPGQVAQPSEGALGGDVGVLQLVFQVLTLAGASGTLLVGVLFLIFVRPRRRDDSDDGDDDVDAWLDGLLGPA